MSVKRTGMLLTAAVLAAPVAVAISGGPAQSAFPGTNGKIVFVDDADADNLTELHTINPDGTEQAPLTDSTVSMANDLQPVWSPDGSKIAFARREASSSFSDIFVVKGDGTDVRNVTNDLTAFNDDPAWSPDGGAIAFVAQGRDIVRINADGTGRTQLTDSEISGIVASDPSWSPDGTEIAYAANNGSGSDVYVMNADGSEPTNLTNSGTDREPSWSPSGDRIAFVSVRDGNPEIYVMSADGGAVDRRTNNSADDTAPAWSPDGTEIVFQRDRDGFPPDLYTRNAIGQAAEGRLGTAGGAAHPDWQPLVTDFGRVTMKSRIIPATDPGRVELWLDSTVLVPRAGDGASRTATVSPGFHSVSVGIPGGVQLYQSSVACTRNGAPFVADANQPNIGFDVVAGDFITCTITNVRIYNTAPGMNVTVTPTDPTTGDTPVTITFDRVTGAGDTALFSSASGPPASSGFQVAGVYYWLATSAQFDQAEVCFPIVPPAAPTIAHWVDIPPVFTTPVTYYKDAAGPTGAVVPAGQGNVACTTVTSFSPFALVVPAATEDAEAPLVVCGSSDAAWHGANVSIDCTAHDEGSGLADPSNAAFTLSTSVPDGAEDGNAATGTREVCDVAGNCATAGPIGANRIDRKRPTLVLPADLKVDATSPAGATVSSTASASDGADPNPTVTCSPAAGSTLAIGTTTVACTATDHVGNQASGSFRVTVLGAKEQLTRLVNDVVSASRLSPAVKSQLLANLQPLLERFDPAEPSQRKAVCTTLRLFTAALRLLSGHGVPPGQATAWIGDATRIRAVLGC